MNGVRDALDTIHQDFKDKDVAICQLRIPDPETINAELTKDKNSMIQHNLDHGIITAIDEEHSKYSWRGQLFLWKQSLKDLLRIG